jgi:predicted transcriptional regulator YdeE
MNNEATYNIKIMKLSSPIFVAGTEVRVKHGTPECFPAINALCTRFISEGTPSKIQNKIEPMIRFGLCIDHVYYEDIIEFTYIIGVQVQELTVESKLPELVKCYTIPTGKYACINVSSPDASTTIGIAYTRLDRWINESQDWESIPGEYEIYPNPFSSAKMELWRPVKRKG